MRSLKSSGFGLIAAGVLLSAGLFTAPAQAANPVVVVKTNLGTFEAELFRDKAPISVENFLQYVEKGFYQGTIFHRVIPNFMVQGGGFDLEQRQKETRPPIKNEAHNGLKNTRGTLAMARTSVVDSATAQFFVNLKDNAFLDHGGRDFGYAVFGKVLKGMEVIDKIAAVKTGRKGQFPQDCPLENVIIESIQLKK